MTTLKLPVFTLLSGIGWCIDFAIFNLLVWAGHSGFASNLVSATAGVSFVLLTARRWIFRDHAERLEIVVLKYIVWNIVAIGAASLLIGGIAHYLEGLSFAPVQTVVYDSTGIALTQAALVSNIAKLLVTPITMYANFVVMGWIIERRVNFY